MASNGRKRGKGPTTLGSTNAHLMFSPTAHVLDLRSSQHHGQLVQNPMELGTWAGRQAIRYVCLLEEQILGILH